MKTSYRGYMPTGLHVATRDALQKFAEAVAERLFEAQKMREDLGKGVLDWQSNPLEWIQAALLAQFLDPQRRDPLDAAAYCMFLWARNAPIATPQVPVQKADYWLAVAEGEVLFGMDTDDGNDGAAARQEMNDWINERMMEAPNGPVIHLVGAKVLSKEVCDE